MTGRRILGGLIVAAVVACGLMGAVVLAVDDDATEEKPASSNEAPCYRATIRKAPSEAGGAERSSATGKQPATESLSDKSLSDKEKRAADGPATEWVTDLGNAADAPLCDESIAEEAAQPREKDAADAVLDPNLAEILRIRRELGNDPYRGTIFEGVNPKAGVGGDEDRPSGGSPGENPDGEFAAALRMADAATRDQPRVPDYLPDRPTWRTDGPPASVLVVDLRRAARGLDAKAADLEDVERCGEADQLRQLARRLRTTARRWRGGMGSGPLP